MSFLRNLFRGDKKKKQQQLNQLQHPPQANILDHQAGLKQHLQSPNNELKQVAEYQNQLKECFMKSCLVNDSLEKISTEELKVLTNLLELKDLQRSSQQKNSSQLSYFLNLLQSNHFQLSSKLKILTALHKFIIELGDYFAQEFLEHNLNQVFSFNRFGQEGHKIHNNDQLKSNKSGNTIPRNDIEGWMHENIISHYFNYLLRLANNYQIYKICVEEGELPETDDAKLDYKLKFMWLFKLSNLFSYILPIHTNIVIVLQELHELSFIQDIALLLLHDCVSFYNVMSKEMSKLLESYTLLTAIDSIQFYQIYCEVHELSNSLKQFYKMKELFDQQDFIIEPLWFNLTVKKHKEIEMYAHKVELLNVSAAEMRKTLKNGMDGFANQQQINFTETNAQNRNDIEKQAKQKTGFDGNSNSNNVKKNERAHSESAVKGRQMMQLEEDYEEMKEEDIKAIRIFEKMLKEQKKIEQGQVNEDGKGKVENDEEMEEEEKEEEENTNKRNNIDAFIANISDNKVIENQEILFSPGKPVTFRCQLAVTGNKNIDNNDKPRIEVDKICAIKNNDIQNGEENTLEQNVKDEKQDNGYYQNTAEVKYCGESENKDIQVQLDQMASCESEDEEDNNVESVQKGENQGNINGDQKGKVDFDKS